MKTRDSGDRRAGHAGFTLIEMLVVMFIIGIVLALVVGVSRYVKEESSKKQTISVQQVLLAAVQAYYEANNPRCYPEEITTSDPDTAGSITTATESSGQQLIVRLKSIRASLDKINQGGMPADVLDMSNGVKDGFGRWMRYRLLDGKSPVIISAGRDGVFGDSDKDKAADNVRSESQ